MPPSLQQSPQSPSGNKIGEKVFTQDDQVFFAELSGDNNPMHLDAIYSRKIFDGKPIVHGMHLLLWALQYGLQRHSLAGQTLRCDFSQPVFVGEQVDFFEEPLESGGWILRVQVKDVICARFRLLRASVTAPADPLYSADAELLQWPQQPTDTVAGDQVGNTYYVSLTAQDTSRFDAVNKRFGAGMVAALCAISRFAGVVCPGLNSLMATLELNLHQSTESSELIFAVQHYDKRFGMYTIALGGICSGQMRAVQRALPRPQPSVKQLIELVTADEFAGTRSLVVGGSRGLGAWTARALVAGGGNVIITYRQGYSEALVLCNELNRFRADSCELRQWDVHKPVSDCLSATELQSLSHIYFYATPRIFRRRSAAYNQALYDEFVACYVTALSELVKSVETVSQRSVVLFAPSSVAVTDTPGGMQEYADAKRQMEKTVEQFNCSCCRVRTLTARLPRLDTDQTASLSQPATGSITEVMLPLLRSVQACKLDDLEIQQR